MQRSKYMQTAAIIIATTTTTNATHVAVAVDYKPIDVAAASARRSLRRIKK